MQPTGDLRREAAVAAAVVVIAVVVDRPVLLLGAAGVAAAVVARQYAALRSFAAVDDALTVAVGAGGSNTVVGRATTVPIAVSLGRPVDCAVRVTVDPPVPASPEAEPATIDLPAGTTTAEATLTFAVPVAGRFALPDAAVEIVDSSGRIEETLSRATDTEIDVAARSPRDVHVGAGGRRVAAANGAHASGSRGSGLVPVETRPYVAGDSLANIDWKATARFDSPHVREFEVETELRTVLVVDRRTAMATGPPGETKLDYARDVALGYAARAERQTDPLGLYVVGEGTVTDAVSPTSGSEGYRRIRDALHGLEVRTDGAPSVRPSVDSPVAPFSSSVSLEEGSSAFDRTLRPFFSVNAASTDRVDGDPLVAAVERARIESADDLLTVLMTDDTDRRRVREAVSVARRGSGRVIVLLAPHVLFEPGGLGRIELAYDRYAEFESFRRTLDGLAGVRALEVAPRDRIEAVRRGADE